WGNGDGSVQAFKTFNVGNTPYDLEIADFNNDGKLDIVAADQGANQVSVIFSQGNRVFTSSTEYVVGKQPTGLAAGDLNKDNKPDVVTGNPGDSDLSVLLNQW